jgi:hypothetical protein
MEAYETVEYTLRRPEPPIQDGFRQYLIQQRAAFDPDGAWALALREDLFVGPWSQQSRTAMLHWIATRPPPGSLGFAITRFPLDAPTARDRAIAAALAALEAARALPAVSRAITTWLPGATLLLAGLAPPVWVVLLWLGL